MSLESLTSIERQRRILSLLLQQDRLSVAEVCGRFGVSEATARRDLDALAEAGKIERVHGGAILAEQAPPELPILQRENEQREEKARMGRLVASLISAGETIFLGSGTSVLEVARQLRDRRGLTIITNSLPVINMLAGSEGLELIALGGILRESELSFIGYIAEQALAEIRVDKVILGIRAISLEHGLTNDYMQETMTDRAILKTGTEVIIVADHTKCGVVSTAFVAPLTSMHKLVTDAGTPRKFISALASQGIDVLVA